MSFFNKMLASVGIGSSKVDTKLEKSSYEAGEIVRGEVEIYGGNVEQTVDAIFLTLYTTYIKELDDTKYTSKAPIEHFRVSEGFKIGPNERKTIPFSFQLPYEMPITVGSTRVWIKTELDIKSGADSEDKDYIEIRPSRIASSLLNAVTDLGLTLRKADCEKASYRYGGKYPFIQEFEFVPVSGPFRGILDELEIVFLAQSENAVEILMQVDRRARGFGGFLAEALDADESNVRLTFTLQDIPYLRDRLQQTIAKYS
ncbi:sporulation protein SpoOM [Ureibacillus massiliensis 4400831 = CIP 108448 = CCUG 49529]|uniref:Sporulation protein SpoOM n=1 Tax=Ureibacillus massiliensis 4400831 = CIP 108448 = CCUG 49529 TaxID=1211035 RepID=A0A0A3JUQ9_9BACL|nr:sporulation protein [Ureibacillus massiliensis]KGR90742.1 sporulation protein SpoOM [Ureibacillus massiliensis 4400831 = CIP 108448 = CCUG 49529]